MGLKICFGGKQDRKCNLQYIVSFVVEKKIDFAVWDHQFVGRVA